jgi:hypothetical protein
MVPALSVANEPGLCTAVIEGSLSPAEAARSKASIK